jgi:hypothetical protein
MIVKLAALSVLYMVSAQYRLGSGHANRLTVDMLANHHSAIIPLTVSVRHRLAAIEQPPSLHARV